MYYEEMRATTKTQKDKNRENKTWAIVLLDPG